MRYTFCSHSFDFQYFIILKETSIRVLLYCYCIYNIILLRIYGTSKINAICTSNLILLKFDTGTQEKIIIYAELIHY